MSDSSMLADDVALLAALRRGDESAYVELIEHYQPQMIRLARLYVPNQSVAEEVVQETWLGVLQGLSRFEGRASLKTWLFRILTNRARTRGEREGRVVNFSALEIAREPESADPSWFLPPGHEDAGYWRSYPPAWSTLPEARLLADEMLERVRHAIACLSAGQQAVITLRDVEGFAAHEVCDILGISEANQRVLLHRGRARVRRMIEEYLGEGPSRL